MRAVSKILVLEQVPWYSSVVHQQIKTSKKEKEMQSLYTRIYKDLRKSTLLAVAAILGLVGIVPLLTSIASAAPALAERELQASSGVPSDTGVTLTWIFDTTDLGAATNVDHIEIEFCDSPLGACTTEEGDTDNGATDGIPQINAAPSATLTGPWTTTTVTATTRQAGDGGGTNNQILIDKTTADDTNNANELQIAIGGFTNDDEVNQSYYTRMRLYSDAGTTLEWEGVFAQSTAQTLNVSARVQERLNFCVGATAVDDATTSPGADCTAISGTNVDLGVIDTTASVTPVAAVDGGNVTNGIAFINTNASVGSTVQYAALDEGGNGGKLKVDGVSCTDNVSTIDQCFNSLTAQTDITSGSAERFGMTVAGVNCGSSSGTGYTCDYSAGDTSIGPVGNYIGGAYTVGTSGTYGSGTGFIWDDSGSYVTIAQTSNVGTGTHVIDDEALILRFGAQAALTTPTGLYDVDADFVATPTF